MSQHVFGGKISKFGNFTVRNNVNNEDGGENKPSLRGLEKCVVKPHKEQSDAVEQQHNNKEKNLAARAPLGEFVLNVPKHSSSTYNNVLFKGLGPILEVPSSVNKVDGSECREQFEIFVEEQERKSDEFMEMVQCSQMELKGEKSPTKNRSTEVMCKSQAIFLSPGKENIKPSDEKQANNSEVAKSVESNDENSSSAKEGSPTDGEEDDDCPSEYMTAHCSLKSTNGKLHQPLKNPMYIAYDLDIYRWMLHLEHECRPRSSYMAKQSQINEEMRAILIDWFVDVMGEFELSPPTFFLSVSIVDRTLSIMDCPRDKLQLLGAAAILIAAKMHEIFPPLIKDLVYVTDDSYREDQVQRMEKIIMKVIDFRLSLPLVDSFAEFFDHFAAKPLDLTARHLMWYLLELSTLSFDTIRFRGSRLAAAAYLIALRYQVGAEGKENEAAEEKRKFDADPVWVNVLWSDELESKTLVNREELAEPVSFLLGIHANAKSSPVQGVRKKFDASKRFRVARIVIDFAASQEINSV